MANVAYLGVLSTTTCPSAIVRYNVVLRTFFNERAPRPAGPLLGHPFSTAPSFYHNTPSPLSMSEPHFLFAIVKSTSKKTAVNQRYRPSGCMVILYPQRSRGNHRTEPYHSGSCLQWLKVTSKIFPQRSCLGYLPTSGDQHRRKQTCMSSRISRCSQLTRSSSAHRTSVSDGAQSFCPFSLETSFGNRRYPILNRLT